MAFLHHGMVGDPDPDDNFFLAGAEGKLVLAWHATVRAELGIQGRRSHGAQNSLVGG